MPDYFVWSEAEVRRAVWQRDANRCAYVSPDGRRCTETRWLELHHRQPYACGGERARRVGP